MVFIISNWGYLILNNRDYWVPHMAASANAIRAKLQQLPNLANRLYFEDADKNGGFAIFSFIDNTLIQFTRPGGPINAGEGAPQSYIS
jgi:hypothetical protein